MSVADQHRLLCAPCFCQAYPCLLHRFHLNIKTIYPACLSGQTAEKFCIMPFAAGRIDTVIAFMYIVLE